MEATKPSNPVDKLEKYDEHSLKGTLFSVLAFVGGGIVSFIVLLFVLYMTRL